LSRINHPIKNDRLVTPEMIERLPELVKRYMKFTGVVGKPWIDTARVKYSGTFRLTADKPWMPIIAEQSYTTHPPGFVWKAWFKIAGLPLMYGHDTYQAGHGHMFGKFAGIFTLFDARGTELDQGSLLRYLNEATWFPIALLGENIAWQGVDDHSADVTCTDGGKSVSTRMFFDDAGRMTNFRAQRYRENNGAYSLDTWETPMDEYGTFGGLNIPVRGRGVWKLVAGDLPYINIALEKVEYNYSP
jgi:hypothetical protein